MGRPEVNGVSHREGCGRVPEDPGHALCLRPECLFIELAAGENTGLCGPSAICRLYTIQHGITDGIVYSKLDATKLISFL